MAASLILLGALGMAAQAAYLREVLATFASGELIIGIVLASWLFWTALGSGLLGRFGAKHNQDRLFHRLLPWYGLSGYAGVLVIARTPMFFGLVPGELVSLDLQAAAAAVALAPCTILGGFLFTTGARSIMSKGTNGAGRAYLFEAIGAAAAGIAVSIAASENAPNSLIALSCAVFACLGALTYHLRSKNRTGLVTTAAILLVTAGLGTFINLRPASHGTEHLLAEHDTRYHRLRITQTGEQITFYANTAVLFSAPDPERAEYAVHLPLLAHGDPRSVLIIGGGPGGMAVEAIRYPAVEHVVCVELDPAIFTHAKAFLDEQWHNDPRIELIADDGRAFLNRTAERFDAIILTLPPPLSGSANRYYTREFYELAAAHMNEPGILGFSVEGAENYIPASLAGYLASVRATLETVFPSVAMLPGDRCRVLAGNVPGMNTGLSWEALEETRRRIGIEPSYVRDYYLRYLFSPGRIAALESAIDAAPAPPINTDTTPASLIQRTVIQGELDGSSLIRFNILFGDRLWLTGGMVLAVLLFALMVLIPGRGAVRRTVGITVVSVGLTEISLELLAILAYQSVFGFLYARIALVTGAYMTGLAVGAYIGERTALRTHGSLRLLGMVQGAVAVVPLLWIALLVNRFVIGVPAIIEAGFYLLAALSGLLGGAQFPLADQQYRDTLPDKPAGIGTIYALDLAGSATGALVTVSLLIPALGMVTSLVVFAALNAVLASLLFVRSARGV